MRAFIAGHPGMSRRRLSENLCEAWQWKQGNGALCSLLCRGLMLMLHRAGEIEFPPVRQISLNPFVRRARPQPALIDRTPVNSIITWVMQIVREIFHAVVAKAEKEPG